MAEKKMTKREYFDLLLEVVKGNEREDELVTFLTNEKERLTRKSSTKTPTQKENEKNVEIVYQALVNYGKPATITELMSADETVGAFSSNQKVSALMRMLLKAERVVKTVDKKKSYFSVATED